MFSVLCCLAMVVEPSPTPLSRPCTEDGIPTIVMNNHDEIVTLLEYMANELDLLQYADTALETVAAYTIATYELIKEATTPNPLYEPILSCMALLVFVLWCSVMCAPTRRVETVTATPVVVEEAKV